MFYGNPEGTHTHTHTHTHTNRYYRDITAVLRDLTEKLAIDSVKESPYFVSK